MPEAVPSWKTSDGTVHTNYLDALKHELFLWLKKANDNDVAAKAIVAALDLASVKMMIETLTKIAEQLEKPTTFQVVSDHQP